jgi:phosphate transport system protein
MTERMHTVSAYDEELGFLSNRIAEMGGYAERMVDRAVTALINSDHALSKQVIAEDVVLDNWHREIDDKSVLIIAKRQPMARDLREIIGTMRIASDLERIGDLGKNIAKRTVAVAEVKQPLRLYRGLESLAELAMIQLKEVLDTFANRRMDGIELLRDRDEEIDAKYTSLFRELLTYMMEDPRNISACTHLLFCAKNIERIGDHVTNIAETIHYMETGEGLATERPKDDKHNAVTVSKT